MTQAVASVPASQMLWAVVVTSVLLEPTDLVLKDASVCSMFFFFFFLSFFFCSFLISVCDVIFLYFHLLEVFTL